MSTEQNKAIVRDRINGEMISQNRLDLVDELFTESFVNHSAPPGLPTDREGVKMFFGALHAAFSGLHVTVEDQVAEGDKVVTRKTFRGTHLGEQWGLPPTGNRVQVEFIDIIRIQDGLLVEHWHHFDFEELHSQMRPAHTIPASEQPAGTS